MKAYEQLGLKNKYNFFLLDEAKYVLAEQVEKAYAKKPAERSNTIKR